MAFFDGSHYDSLVADKLFRCKCLERSGQLIQFPKTKRKDNFLLDFLFYLSYENTSFCYFLFGFCPD